MSGVQGSPASPNNPDWANQIKSVEDKYLKNITEVTHDGKITIKDDSGNEVFRYVSKFAGKNLAEGAKLDDSDIATIKSRVALVLAHEHASKTFTAQNTGFTKWSVAPEKDSSFNFTAFKGQTAETPIRLSVPELAKSVTAAAQSVPLALPQPAKPTIAAAVSVLPSPLPAPSAQPQQPIPATPIVTAPPLPPASSSPQSPQVVSIPVLPIETLDAVIPASSETVSTQQPSVAVPVSQTPTNEPVAIPVSTAPAMLDMSLMMKSQATISQQVATPILSAQPQTQPQPLTKKAEPKPLADDHDFIVLSSQPPTSTEAQAAGTTPQIEISAQALSGPPAASSTAHITITPLLLQHVPVASHSHTATLLQLPPSPSHQKFQTSVIKDSDLITGWDTRPLSESTSTSSTIDVELGELSKVDDEAAETNDTTALIDRKVSDAESDDDSDIADDDWVTGDIGDVADVSNAKVDARYNKNNSAFTILSKEFSITQVDQTTKEFDTGAIYENETILNGLLKLEDVGDAIRNNIDNIDEIDIRTEKDSQVIKITYKNGTDEVFEKEMFSYQAEKVLTLKAKKTVAEIKAEEAEKAIEAAEAKIEEAQQPLLQAQQKTGLSPAAKHKKNASLAGVAKKVGKEVINFFTKVATEPMGSAIQFWKKHKPEILKTKWDEVKGVGNTAHWLIAKFGMYLLTRISYAIALPFELISYTVKSWIQIPEICRSLHSERIRKRMTGWQTAGQVVKGFKLVSKALFLSSATSALSSASYIAHGTSNVALAKGHHPVTVLLHAQDVADSMRSGYRSAKKVWKEFVSFMDKTPGLNLISGFGRHFIYPFVETGLGLVPIFGSTKRVTTITKDYQIEKELAPMQKAEEFEIASKKEREAEIAARKAAKGKSKTGRARA